MFYNALVSLRPAQPRTRRLHAMLLSLPFILVPGALLTQPAHAQTLTVVYSFTGGSDGSGPGPGVVRDSAGNLYGATAFGGAHGLGTVFKVDTQGNETVLHSFVGGTDGAHPGFLLRDSTGTLYGITSVGGGNVDCNSGQGCGTVFKLDPHGKETVLHAFGGPTDGESPTGLIRDTKGNLYGSTYYGGGASGAGTLFKITSTGRTTVLYMFTGGADGANPVGVTRDAAGNLFGTTATGGTNTGTVFRLSPSLQETVLYSFAGGTDGADPAAGVVDAAGNLYGSTYFGGLVGFGTLFKVDQSGNETVLHQFTGADGIYPNSTMIMDSAGNLYGTTLQGGQYGGGTVFKLDASGNLTTLHRFNGAEGKYPEGPLVRDASGNLYGTTEEGGVYGWGTVFKLALQ